LDERAFYRRMLGAMRDFDSFSNLNDHDFRRWVAEFESRMIVGSRPMGDTRSLLPASGHESVAERDDRVSSRAGVSSRPVKTPVCQRSTGASARVACRPLLRFVQPGSE
jgi:hypothetical protein